MSKVYVFMADGTEEVEALTVIDLLRRAAVQVVTVSVMGRKKIVSSYHIGIETDEVYGESDYKDADMLVLPGGMPGTRNLEKVPALMEQVKAFAADGRYIAAICAAPSVFGHLGLLEGRSACCYPGFEEELTGALVSYNSCEADGNIITARGMGCAIDFGLKIIEKLVDERKSAEIGFGIIY